MSYFFCVGAEVSLGQFGPMFLYRFTTLRPECIELNIIFFLYTLPHVTSALSIAIFRQRRCHRVATWASGMQQFDRYTGALPSRHWWVSMPSLYFTHSGMSSKCNPWCISCDSPWSNFLVSLTTRAAAFNTRFNLSVVVFGAPARIALQ